MIGPEDDELLHRALDGALSAEEAKGLQIRLAAEPALAARAEELGRVGAMVNELGGEAPPSGFSDRVMAEVASASHPRTAWHWRLASLPGTIGRQLFPWSAHRSEQGDHFSDSFRRAGMAGGGVIVAKKVLWGVAGLAVVVILAVVYFNGRTVDQGAQGAIGAADRYRGAQPSSVDAKTGSAEAFLQSDTFDKIIKNKDVRNLLGDADICALLADDAVQTALKDEGTLMALQDVEVQAALKAPGAQMFLNDKNAAAMLVADQEVAALRKLSGDDQTAALRRLSADDQANALRRMSADEQGNALRRMTADEQGNALRRMTADEQGNALRRMTADEQGNALRRLTADEQGNALRRLTADEQGNALRRLTAYDQANALRRLSSDEGAAALRKLKDVERAAVQANLLALEAMLNSPKLMRLAENDAFAAALRVGGYRLFAAEGIGAMLRDQNLMKVIGNPDFEAALKSGPRFEAAIQAKLREK
jgi:hypothetical protein